MTRVLALCAFAALAACGIDGEPEQPTRIDTVNIGVAGGSSGVYDYGGVGVSNGPLSIFIGF